MPDKQQLFTMPDSQTPSARVPMDLARRSWPPRSLSHRPSERLRRFIQWPLRALLVGLLTGAAHGQFAYIASEGTITITGYTGPGGEVVIPDTLDGLPVTFIGEYAFMANARVTDVVIPDSVTHFGEGAFAGCTGLAGVVIGNRVASIGYRAFSGCTGLESVAIPDSVARIDSFAFSGCTSLVSVTIGDGVNQIGDYAFSGCINLANVIIPDNVTSIGCCAFSGSTGLTRATIGNRVSRIESQTFSACTSLRSIEISESVTGIGSEAFSGCTSLTSVIIPDSVISIEGGAFAGCSGLTRFSIGKGVTSIDPWAFVRCINLNVVEVDSLNPAFSSLEGVLFDKAQTTVLLYPHGKKGAYTIPNSVTTIASWGEISAFSGCSNLTGVVVPFNLTNNIDCWTFFDCTSLTEIEVDSRNPTYSSAEGVLLDKGRARLILYPGGKKGAYTLPGHLTHIGNLAFLNCSGLTGVVIADSVNHIGDYAFADCTGLKSVIVPASVRSIGYGAFSGCIGLASVTIGPGVSEIGDGAFSGCTRLTKAYFQGKAPALRGQNPALWENSPATVFHLDGSSGWGPAYAGRTTATWENPVALEGSLGLDGNALHFTIACAPSATVVVEASPTLSSPAWSPVSTVLLTSGVAQFRDPQAAMHPVRFYRLRSK